MKLLNGKLCGEHLLYSEREIKSEFFYGVSPEVVCTVRLAIGFLLVLSKWCAQSQLAIGF